LPLAVLLPLVLLTLATPVLATPLDDAQDAAAEGRWSEAADLYADVVEAEPGSRAALLGLAEAIVEAKRWDLFTTLETPLQALHQAAREDVEVRLALARLFEARAGSVTQPLEQQALLARAKAHYAGLAEAVPELEDAAVGLARVLHEEGACREAVEALDRYVNLRPKRAARALHWKGRILYEVGRARHLEEGGGYPLSEETGRFFARSQGASLSSAMADPTSFDTWMHVAWASTVLGDRETAHQAYEKAYAIDPESPLPLKGIIALLAHDPEAVARAKEKLARLDPDQRRTRVQAGYELLDQEAWLDLRAFAEAYIRDYGESADAAYWLGQVEEAAQQEERAIAHYLRAIELDGAHLEATEELDSRLRVNALARAKSSVEDARALYADYRRVLDLATQNPYVRNNCAFALREGWNAHKEEPGWKEILLLSTRTYEEAARVIGPWRDEKQDALPWGRRYGYAQIVNDTAVIFHQYAPVKDHERAERYYVRALRYVDWGYLDAWTYLRQIYEEQARWQDLYDLAVRCANGLASEAGAPLEPQREAAAKVAADLVAAGRAKPPSD
jgi:tetratricopeptide (TPR) repeat protein